MMTLLITAEEGQALKKAFPDLAPEDAVLALLRSELRRRCRVPLKRARLVLLQGLKKPV